MVEQEDTIEITKSKFELYFVRYAAVAALLATSIVYAQDWFDKVTSLHNFLGVLCFFLGMVLVSDICSRKFIYRVLVNKSKDRIVFHMYKKNKIIQANFSELQSVKVNFYISFVVHNKTLLYGTAGEDVAKLVDTLNIVLPVEFGSYGKWLCRKKVNCKERDQ